MSKRSTLPEEYRQIRTIDMIGSSKDRLIVNGLCLLLFAGMSLSGLWLLYRSGDQTVLRLPFPRYFLWMLAVMAACAAFAGLKILCRCSLMERFARELPKIRMARLYLCTPCGSFFKRGEYLAVCLVPPVLWALVLFVFMPVVTPLWQPAVWILQTVNLAGSARDLYGAYRLFMTGGPLLVRDDGLVWRIYAPGSEYPA